MSILDNSETLSPKERVIQSVYQEESSHRSNSALYLAPPVGNIPPGKVLKAEEAIPRLLGTHVPRDIEENLAAIHVDFHLGQELHDDRCPLCKANPVFKKEDSQDQREERPQQGKKQRERKSEVFGLNILICDKLVYLGAYDSPGDRDFARNCAVEELGLDEKRMKQLSATERPCGVRERMIREKVKRWVNKAIINRTTDV